MKYIVSCDSLWCAGMEKETPQIQYFQMCWWERALRVFQDQTMSGKLFKTWSATLPFVYFVKLFWFYSFVSATSIFTQFIVLHDKICIIRYPKKIKIQIAYTLVLIQFNSNTFFVKLIMLPKTCWYVRLWYLILKICFWCTSSFMWKGEHPLQVLIFVRNTFLLYL